MRTRSAASAITASTIRTSTESPAEAAAAASEAEDRLRRFVDEASDAVHGGCPGGGAASSPVPAPAPGRLLMPKNGSLNRSENRSAPWRGAQ